MTDIIKDIELLMFDYEINTGFKPTRLYLGSQNMLINNFKNKIIQGDCLDVMRNFADGSVDMILTSPPYDNLRTYKGFVFEFEDIARELYRVVKTGGVVVWVVNDATIAGTETGTSFTQALFFKEVGFNLHDTMIFRKRNPIPQIYRRRYNNEFEYMFVFSKGQVTTHNPLMVDCLHAGLELGSTTYKNYSKHEQKRGKIANPVKAQKIKGNIWEYVVGKNLEDQEAKGHPAPFPCELARDHIRSWSNEGDTVLDPMCGSGTTCKAAKQLGRNYIGIDTSHEYCDIARNRVDETSAPKRQQLSLDIAANDLGLADAQEGESRPEVCGLITYEVKDDGPHVRCCR